MRYSDYKIVFQEIPNEISLAFYITGCPLRCKNCHSSEYWNVNLGTELLNENFKKIVNEYKKYITCVVFLGGEWEKDILIKLLQWSNSQNIKTALYTGLDVKEVGTDIIEHLDYLKYGPYIQELGPLSSKTTNQRLIHLKTGEDYTIYFQQKEDLC